MCVARRDKIVVKRPIWFSTRGLTTVNQRCYLYHFFSKGLDGKKDLHIIVCDISKAFDQVQHIKGLIYKFYENGISGCLLVWFIDYWKDHHQKVVIGGQQPEKDIIKGGVPEGSMLGPLLFQV